MNINTFNRLLTSTQDSDYRVTPVERIEALTSEQQPTGDNDYPVSSPDFQLPARFRQELKDGYDIVLEARRLGRVASDRVDYSDSLKSKRQRDAQQSIER